MLALVLVELPSSNMHPATRRKQSIVDRLSGKQSKESATYRDGNEANTKSSCAECEYYLHPGQAESSCGKVAGVVEARSVCDLFTPRVSEHGNGQGVELNISLSVQP